jgi:CheY-like chemotaxis protein
MQQILFNLISNAVKFTRNRGKISVQTSNDADGQIEIDVADTGAGLDEKMLGRLFTAFEQSDRTMRLGGMGLGLSIAKSLAEMHEGTLTAASDGRDRGSTFRLRFKTMPFAEPPALPTKPQGVLQLDRNILLVEDHEDTRKVMARLLRSLGCRVTAAANVREALAAAETEQFDLLISDIGLPDGSGLEIMQNLKDRVRRGIALSGYGQEEDIRRSREAGFALHLIKPVNFKTLQEVLRR